MQPNELNSNDIPAVSSQPTKKPKKRFLIALSTLGVILVSAIIALTMSFLGKTSPEDLFYKALENHMSTSYIGQKYTTKQNFYGSEMTIIGDSRTDFSEVTKPITEIKYTVDMGNKRVIDMDMIATKDYTDYIKISRYGDDMVPGENPFDYKSWYYASDERIASNVDFANSGGSINQTFGELLVGNYKKSDRADLIKMYKDEECFKFDPESVEKKEVDGINVYVYKIKQDVSALKKVNQEAAKLLGVSVKDLDFSDEGIELTVDAKTKRFIKATFAKYGTKNEIDFSYPTSLDIKIPKDAKEWPDPDREPATTEDI